VSEATVFNYFPTKEDLVYSRLEAFEDELLGAIRTRPAGESVLAAFGRFVLEPRGLLAAEDEGAAEALAEISRMIATSPALLARERQVFARYTDALAALIAEETGAAADDARPWIVANALIGVHRALLDHVRGRVLAGAYDVPSLARDVRAQGERALALLEQGLRDYGVRS
jgi:AcrR family transcriptional regulator